MQMSSKDITLCSNLLVSYYCLKGRLIAFLGQLLLEYEAVPLHKLDGNQNPATRRYNPEDLNTEVPHSVNLKSRIPISYPVSLSVGSRQAYRCARRKAHNYLAGGFFSTYAYTANIDTVIRIRAQFHRQRKPDAN